VNLLGFYGFLRYLIATDRGGAIWGIAVVVGTAIFTGSPTATLIALVLVVAALAALWRLNHVPRSREVTGTGEPSAVAPGYIAALVCAVLGAISYAAGLFHYGFGLTIFALIAYIAWSVSRPRRS
jgi:hypothetical protein